MSNLPDPLTPPYCDLRGYDFMPLLGHRLFRSTWYRLAKKHSRAGIAALRLWWEAFLQKPAGSLPNDEDELASLADFGEDVRTWRKHRDVAMHGFILCSDNRWYHPVVSEEALEAYGRRIRSNDKREKDRQRLADWRARQKHQPDPPDTPDETRFPTSDETLDETHTETVLKPDRQDRTGQDRTDRTVKKDSKTSGTPPVGAREASGSTEPEAVGPKAAADVVVSMQKALRMKAYPPRAAIRSPADQAEAITPTRPKASHLTPEQLALVRGRRVAG